MSESMIGAKAQALSALLKNRHSYRHPFSDRPVTREQLRWILEAAYLAPSGCNLQTPRMIGILDPNQLKTLAAAYPGAWAQTAPAAVVIVTHPAQLPGKGESRYLEDFGAAAENLVLAVESLGLATTWIQGQITSKAQVFAEALGVPAPYQVIGYFPIGYPTTQPHPPAKEPFEARCFLDHYGQPFPED